jgi:putative oxidoreductase
MISLYQRAIAPFAAIPLDLIALIARICVGAVFFRSGLLKLKSFENAVFLFESEYPLPDLPFFTPQITASITMAAELALPVLLFAGFLTRFAALGLLIMTLVIQIFVYPNAFDTHGTWAVGLLFLMKYGAGYVSVDYLLFRDKPVA